MTSKDILARAKYNKHDEFYTLYKDVEKELSYYTNHFKDKIVYCNCDNPKYSNFWKYFYNNFNRLHLKKLIATYYNPNGNAYAWEYEGNGETISVTPLLGNGDFASDDCINYLKQADVVVTNPPFSEFRPFFSLLIKYHKKFIIWGNQNAITYKIVFPLLMHRQAWLGGIANKSMTFRVPKDYKYSQRLTDKINDGHYYSNIPMINTFTNLSLNKVRELIPDKKFNPSSNLTYDNYPAFNVDKAKDLPVTNLVTTKIPLDRLSYWQSFYHDDLEIVNQPKLITTMVNKGISIETVGDQKMVEIKIKRPIYGVPITIMSKFARGSYMDKHYEILGIATGSNWNNINDFTALYCYQNTIKHSKDGTTKPASINAVPVIRCKSKPKGIYYTDETTPGYLKAAYARVLIRRR